MYVLSDLPYALDALEPVVSQTTLETHWGKHHRAYVEKTNLLASEAGLAGEPLEAVVKAAAADKGGKQKLFNNAGQAWNHGFYWQSMTPVRRDPVEALSDAIADAFADLDGLKAAFVAEGADHFASGWAWLVWRDRGLAVISTHDADTALTRDGLTPLLVCDVWEHAYYLDYKQDRKSYLERWFDTVANWSFAASQLQAAQAGRAGWSYPLPQSS